MKRTSLTNENADIYLCANPREARGSGDDPLTHQRPGGQDCQEVARGGKQGARLAGGNSEVLEVLEVFTSERSILLMFASA